MRKWANNFSFMVTWKKKQETAKWHSAACRRNWQQCGIVLIMKPHQPHHLNCFMLMFMWNWNDSNSVRWTASLAFNLNVGCTINFIVKFKTKIEQITSMHFNELMTKQCWVWRCAFAYNTQIGWLCTMHSIMSTTIPFASIVGVEREKKKKIVNKIHFEAKTNLHLK